MPVAQIEPDKGSLAVTDAAPVNLLRVVVQLMPVTGYWGVSAPENGQAFGWDHIQMLRPGVALPAALLGTLELLIQPFAASPPLARRAVRIRRVLPLVTAVFLIGIVQIKPLYVFVVRCAAWATTPLVLGFMFDIIRGLGPRRVLHCLGRSR